MEEVEIWKDIKEFPGYEVSNLGRIRSSGKYLYGEFHEGYLRIELQSRWKGKKRIRVFIHRLVLEAFVGPCPINHVPHHKDANKSNNRLDNLEWVTCGDHQRIAYATGSRYSKGDFHSQAKLKSKDVLEIRELVAQGACQASVAQNFGTTPQNIHRIINRKTWTHI